MEANNTIPNTGGLVFSDLGLYNMDIRQYISTKLIFTKKSLSKTEIKKHELVRSIFKEWYILGSNECNYFLNTFYDGLDNSIKRIKTFEDIQYGINENLDLRTDCTDIERVTFRIAIIEGVELLSNSNTYKHMNNDSYLTGDKLDNIIKEIKQNG